MTNTLREYGLVIRRINRHGTEYVEATVAHRKPGDDGQPYGCSSDGESEFDRDVPKHMHGLMVDGLGLRGFATDTDADFIGNNIEYIDVYSIDLRKLERMTKTLRRVLKVCETDKAYEPGDKFAALCKALRLTFVCEDRKRLQESNPGFRGERWLWTDVADGRNRFRNLIEEAQKAAREKLGRAA